MKKAYSLPQTKEVITSFPLMLGNPNPGSNTGIPSPGTTGSTSGGAPSRMTRPF